jgi:hypothetical protein
LNAYPLNQNVTFAPEYTKIGNIGFVTRQELIYCLLEEAMKIGAVYGMASRIHEREIGSTLFPK